MTSASYGLEPCWAFLVMLRQATFFPLLLSFSPGHITMRDCSRTQKESCAKNQTGMPRRCCLHKSRVRVSLPHRNGRKMPITRRTFHFAALAVAATEARLACLRAQSLGFPLCLHLNTVREVIEQDTPVALK